MSKWYQFGQGPPSSEVEMTDHPHLPASPEQQDPTLSVSASHNKDNQQAELFRDQLCTLLRLEDSYLVEYLPCTADLSCNDVVAPGEHRVPLDEWRRKICQWSFRVIDHFRLDREIVSVGMNLLDRFLVSYVPPSYASSNSSSPNMTLTPAAASKKCLCPTCKRSFDSQTYQLAAMTCIYLAIKIHIDNGSDDDYNRRKQFQVETFADLSRGMFNVADICALEETVLHTLEWKVSVSTPMTFVNYLLTLIPAREAAPTAPHNRSDLVLHVLRELSRYLTELAVSLGSDTMYYKPSQVAFAAILVSMDLLTYQALPHSVREAFSNQVYHLGFCDKPGLIEVIRHRLKKMLWPDMLLQDGDATDPGHPISMARDCGILNINHIYPPAASYRPLSPPGTPPVKHQGGTGWEASSSPVGVDHRVDQRP